ncbi:MAG: hypothetical protein HYW65_03100 [Candidatus Liptonbacteria bacterium]|nr:hypothetical protein [Candidatus Liptonbacteria bacterium]
MHHIRNFVIIAHIDCRPAAGLPRTQRFVYSATGKLSFDPELRTEGPFPRPLSQINMGEGD